LQMRGQPMVQESFIQETDERFTAVFRGSGETLNKILQSDSRFIRVIRGQDSSVGVKKSEGRLRFRKRPSSSMAVSRILSRD
jgi:hypothetical protein